MPFDSSRPFKSQKTRRWIALLGLQFVLCMTAHGETLFATALTNNVSPAFTTADGLLMIQGFANSNATMTANLGQSGRWFGVADGNVSAIDGAESITLTFAPNSALFRIGHVWTRSRVIISGFASDPGFVDITGDATAVSFTNGTLSYVYPWDGGAEHAFTFTRPEASAGRTLRVNVYDAAPGWQATITRIDYGVGGRTPAVADIGPEHQTIDNFSASDAWSMQNVGLWSDSNRTQVADLLFTTNNGIGLSAWRFNLMAGFDPMILPGTLWQRWRTGNGFQVASNQYDWTRQAGQRWFLSAAKARGIDQFIAMAYSPPTNFTRNGRVYCMDGVGSSNLRPGYETAYAQSIADILAHFETNSALAERCHFDYVMPVNEPFWEWNGNSQEGSRFSNGDVVALATKLRSALDARGLGMEIVLAESGDLQSLYTTRDDVSSEYGVPYGDYLSALDSITNLLSRNLSAHSYFTDNPTNQLVPIRQKLKTRLAAHPRWRYWQSEYCILGAAGPGRDLSMATALDVARVMWADLAIADASAWHWWLSLSQANYKDGLLYTDFWQPGDDESLYCSKNFWAFGQWSRFVRPGWKRIDLPGYDDVFGLMGAAFIEPNTNSVAMVFVNHSEIARRIVPSAPNLSFGNTIPFWSAWITSSAPSDNLSALPPIQPGSDCFIPPNSVVTLVANLRSANLDVVPIIAAIADQSVRSGETLMLDVVIQKPDGPAKLVSVKAFSDNPGLLPDSSVVLTDEIVTNAITREVFVNFSGESLEELAAAPRFPNAPQASHNAGSFEAPQNLGSKYGTRMRGFVVPPQTGNYTFWIASRDASELYLSADENPAAKVRIAWVENEANSREWTRETNQQSAPVGLVAGKRYYIEAVHVSANGGDHLAVGWQLPDGALERPIPGSRISPWSDPFSHSSRRILTLRPAGTAAGTANVFVIATDLIGKAVTNRFAVTVNSSIDPTPTNLTAQVSNAELILSWPIGHVGWQLEAQTNPLSVGLTTNWVALPGSTLTNIWTMALSPSVPSVFYRLSLPIGAK